MRNVSVSRFDVQHVGDESGVQLDGETRRQIKSEMIMGHQHDAGGRQHLHQSFADQLGIGIGEGFVRNLPYFAVRILEGLANRIQLRTGAGDDGGRRGGGINLFCGDHQLGRRVIDHSTFMNDISEDASHYFSPPLAFTNSITLSITSSLLPCSISAPLPSAGTK